MTMEGRNTASPDVSARVMARLGYERAPSAADAHRLRARRAVVLAAQASVVLAACTLGLVWWWSRDDAHRTGIAMGDALHGSLLQGSGQIDRVIAAMPRARTAAGLRTNDGVTADLPSATLENAPQLRSY